MSLSSNRKSDSFHPSSIPLSGVVPKSSAIPPLPERPKTEPTPRSKSDDKPGGNPAEKRSDSPEERPTKKPDKDHSTVRAGTSAAPASGTDTSVVRTASPKAVSTRMRKWQALALDTLLVLMVIGVVGGGGYYLKKQWEQYRVPGIMELTQAECMDLCEQREALQDAANHADEQLLMRSKLARLENQLSEFSQLNDRLRASISNQQNRVLALQHEIRRTDRDYRNVARGLLPGLPIGNVSTKRGRSYPKATISRLMGKRISVRTPEGAASFPVSELIRDNLPTIVLYALGDVDLVDMSDFTSDGTAPSPTTPENSKLRKVSDQTREQADVDYAPVSSGPVVDTDANKTSTNVGDDGLPPATPSDEGGTWQAPTEQLPL